jgi:hypothetical protein
VNERQHLGRELLLVEQYEPGLTAEAFLARRARTHPAEAVRIVSLFIVEDETVLSLFDGVDGAAVAEANQLAGVMFTRVLSTVAVWGEPHGWRSIQSVPEWRNDR